MKKDDNPSVVANEKRIGLIAGGGQFPLIFARSAKKNALHVYAIAYVNEADPQLEKYVDGIEWIHLGQLRKLIRFFKRNRVHEAVMMGTIKKTRIFSDVKPDTKAISLLVGMRDTHDDGMLRAFAHVLEKEDIRICASTFLLPELLAQEGTWTKRRLSQVEKSDVEIGWRCAKTIGRLDIGQCVVVGGGSILAVEAIEGTDATIIRGGKLGKGHAIAVKVSKPHQDTRFDVPAVGTRTLKSMHAAGVRALAIEAGKTVVFDREEMITLANEMGISIVALHENRMETSPETTFNL